MAKDVDGLMACYTGDVRVFDAIPPHETSNAEDYRQIWEGCLGCFPDGFELEIHDRQLTVEGNLAFSTCLFRFIGMPGDDPSMKSYLRATQCLRKVGGAWKIAHEHISVPFNPFTNEAVFILDPNVKLSLEDICDGNACAA